MSTTLNTAILGQEVALGCVDKALKELWGKDAARTKASLMNFAIYSEDPASLEANTRLLAEITEEHACRGILILVLRSDSKPNARAWITAHCQLHDGQKSVCSEQVSFVLEGGNMGQVRNIVFAHLDSDLPLVCWWQGDLTANFDERFYSVMDLLFVDSATWRDPAGGFAKLEAARAERTAKFRAYDLSWLRSHLFRTAIASCFSDAPALAELRQLKSVEIIHSTGHRLSALLLAAWIGMRLKCSVSNRGGHLRLVLPESPEVAVELSEASGSEALQRLTLRSGNASFCVSRECGAAYVCTKVVIGGHKHEQMLPADLITDAALISEQLSRLGGQSLYHQVLPMLQSMFPA